MYQNDRHSESRKYRMLEEYRQHAEERALLGIPPLPLNASQASSLCDLLTDPSEALQGELLWLLRDRVLPSQKSDRLANLATGNPLD